MKALEATVCVAVAAALCHTIRPAPAQIAWETAAPKQTCRSCVVIAGAAAGVSAPVSTLHTCVWSRSRSVLAPPGFMRTVPILSSTRNGCLQDRTQASRGARGRTRACGGVARLLAPCPSRKTTVNYARSTALCLTITEASDQVPWPFAYFLSYCAKYIARRRREERKDVVPRRGRPADCGWSTCSPHLQHVVPYTDGPDAASGAKVPYATLAASQIHATGDAASAH